MMWYLNMNLRLLFHLFHSSIGGNEEGHFQIEESTGVIRVMHPLDRETKKLYELVRLLDIRILQYPKSVACLSVELLLVIVNLVI